jgi:hypothetical protein
VVQPHGVADDLGRKAMAVVRTGLWCHPVSFAYLSPGHQPRLTWQCQGQGSAQRFLSTHGAVYNVFNLQPHLISRPGLRTLRAAAHEAWANATAAA